MDMSKFNNGNLFSLLVDDTDCLGCGIGHNNAKFRFCLGEINHTINEELKPLFDNKEDIVVVDLYLYGIKNLKIKYYSAFTMRYAHVVDFKEIDGELLIRMQDGGIIEFQLGYNSYKWEYVKEYPENEFTVELQDNLAQDIIGAEEYKSIVWND